VTHHGLKSNAAMLLTKKQPQLSGLAASSHGNGTATGCTVVGMSTPLLAGVHENGTDPVRPCHWSGMKLAASLH